MGVRQGWLFPLMVLAASAVSAFGGIGIAAIIGYLPLTPAEGVSTPAGGESVRAVAQAPAAAQTDLVRPAGRSSAKSTKAKE
jgi:hypothetical protein